MQDFFLTFANVGEEIETGEFYRWARVTNRNEL